MNARRYLHALCLLVALLSMDLEALLTKPEGFALTQASDVQRAVCRMMTGVPLGELATNPDVAAIVGGQTALANLPKAPPRMVVLCAAVRTAKSTMVAAKALRNAYLGDCSGLARGEIPRVPIVSVDLDKADETFSKLLGALESPTLESLIVDGKERARSVLVRNISGRPVEIKVVAGARAGKSLVSRWCLGCIFDEAPRMIGAEDGVINLQHALTAIRARMRPGAQIDLVGSPWAPKGPVYELVQSRFGKPGDDVLVIVATGPQLRPGLYTPEYCERIKLEDDAAYEMDVLAHFADPEDALLSSVDVGAAVQSAPMLQSAVDGQHYVAIMDPATRGNGWTLGVLTCPEAGRYETCVAREWLGTRANPLRAGEVLREMAGILEPFGLYEVHTDQWGFDILQEVAELAETGLAFIPQTRDDDVAVKKLETLFGQHALAIPNEPKLKRDLIAMRKRPRQEGGFKVILPQTNDGRHCDYGAMMALAMQVLPDPPVVYRQPTVDTLEQEAIARLRDRQERPMDHAAESLFGGDWMM